MLKSKKKALALAVLCAVSSMGFMSYASAEEVTDADSKAQSVSTQADGSGEAVQTHQLAGITVEGDKDVLPGGMASTKGTMGILGDKDIMDVPFSEVNLTEKTIETFGGPNQPLQSILVNNPAIRVEGTTLHNDISIRGLQSTGTSFYLNGIPGLMTQFNAPTFSIGDIQFISGPNSGITGIPSTYETSTAGGIVNFVTKKAGDEPFTRYKQVFTGKSSLGEYLDVSRRFGKNNEWGVRVNTEILSGDTAIDGHNMKAQGFSANIDHQDDNSKTNLYAAYRHLDIKGGMRWFGLGSGVTKIPGAPDADNDYSFDGMRKEAEGYVFALNHEQKMGDNWKWFMNAGMNHNKLNNNITGQSSRLTIINNQGDISNNIFSTQTVTDNYYGQIGVNGKVQTGEVEHDLTLAFDKAWYTIESAKNNYSGKMGTITGNLYTGITANGFWKPSIETGVSNKKLYWGVSLADTLKYKKSQLLLGVHKHSASVDSYSAASGNHSSKVDSDAVCPTYGYVYQPDEHVSLYASHSENFDAGTIVGSQYVNSGDILDPAKTKQNEIGIKYQNAGLVTNLAFFDIEQANNISVTREDGNHLLQDGEQEYKGIELSVNGRIAPKWNVMGGFLYLDAEQSKTQGGVNDGKAVNGSSKWSAVAALEYEADESFSVIGRMIYNGKSDMGNETMTVPSYVTYDLGVNYKTKINTVPVTLSAMCYNLTDKDYWDAHGTGLLLSNPRTFMLSATFDI